MARPTRKKNPEMQPPHTTAVFFPFDLFGSGGAGAGAELLADEFAEILADNRRESVATRARSYTEHVDVQRFTFETMTALGSWRADGRRAARAAWRRDDFLLWVAGNHLGVLPLYDELAGSDTLVVQLDAHLDIHHFAECTHELSHGNFLLHAEKPLPPLINVGHRELLLTPEYIARHYRKTVCAAELAWDSVAVLHMLGETCAAAPRIFVDIDCDVFDPAFFPAVTQPAPFGLAPLDVLRVLQAVWSERVIGVALSEFEPGRDQNDRSLAVTTWLMEHLLLKRHEA